MENNKDFTRCVEEKRFEYKGFTCVVLMQILGFRTGYVAIPKGQKYYGEHHDDIPIDCHGGLTYSEPTLIHYNDEDVWWIGFDTGHLYDKNDYDKALELFADYPMSIKEINKMKEYQNSYPESTIRTLEYCEQECKRIVDQILDQI